MNDQRDDTIETDATPPPATDPTETAGEAQDGFPATDQRHLTSDDFLVPGPSPESNEGLRRWGLTWLAFSLLLILMMLCLSFVCLTLANWTGIA